MSRVRALLAAAALVAGAAALAAAPDARWQRALPDYAWSFPRDHFAHADRAIEWWYFTGQLESVAEPGRRFGYQFTLFRIGAAPAARQGESRWRANAAVMGHAALGDVAERRHRFSELIYRAAPLLAEFGPAAAGPARVARTRAPAGTGGEWTLDWNGRAFDFAMQDDAQGMAFTLATEPERPLVFHGENGWSQKNAAGTSASQYYSFTRLATRGTVLVDGRVHDVVGTSWMDHEFGSDALDEAQVGWNWFSIQLDDGRDLMLYELRGRDGSVDFARGTLVAPDGVARALVQGDWQARAAGARERDGVRYPLEWKVTVPGAGLDFDVAPLFEPQENVSRLVPGLRYFEGAVSVRDAAGRAIGRGYLELTGYGPGGRLPL